MYSNQFLFFQQSFRESSSIAFRLQEKLRDKFFWSKDDIGEAEKSLSFLQKSLREKPIQELLPYFENATIDKVRRFKRGFHTKSITFATENAQITKKWVFKIGHRISAVVDLGDPSDYQYFHEYQKDVALLQDYCQHNSYLYNLIPEPQECFWMGEKEKKGTILILQPFLTVLSLPKVLKKISPEEKKQLQKELQEIQTMQKFLTDKHKKQLDFLGDGNLVLVKTQDTYHFALVDMGLINMNTPLPLTQFVMQMSYEMMMMKMQMVLHR